MVSRHLLDRQFLDHQILAVYLCLPGPTDSGPKLPGLSDPGSLKFAVQLVQEEPETDGSGSVMWQV